MAKIVWDQTGERKYETGTKKGVLYKKDTTGAYGTGVAWNGLTAVTDSPSGAEENAIYADDMKYLGLRSAEEYGCTIECYTYPDEWMECDGSIELAPGLTAGQQTHRGFGFSWQTVVGNDAQGDQYGYKIHIVYNGTASPSEKSYATINDSPEAVTFSYEVATTPEKINKTINGETPKPSAKFVIDSTKTSKAVMTAIENILYGVDGDEQTATEPRLPLPDEIIDIMSAASTTTNDGENG